MTRLYLIRHGETVWNKLEKTQGCTDVDLSEVGLSQAERLAERLVSEDITVLYSSDLKRAYCTARILGEGLRVPVKTHRDLREMNFGSWEGMDFESIKREYSEVHRLWISSPKKAVIPGGEDLIQVQTRAVEAINGIVRLHRGERIALVSHGITLKCLIFGLLGIDLGYLSKIRLDNCSISVIELRKERFILDCLNDTCHVKG
ncbi:MAG: histidine phosphatase family protein [Bacillota bacterium]|nr:histidine phosphatase family protein [Bacillota bacterium]MDD3850877.1 histidine phosphatase family protein [Bacillota bacterium]MDD4707834.1 histidine phosphatase family protein [Bacillota bacterium]